jgi:hypothetical protein
VKKKNAAPLPVQVEVHGATIKRFTLSQTDSIQFVLGERGLTDYIEVYWDEDERAVVVRAGDGALIVRPHTSNKIVVDRA